jgi:FMN phosphatase YigB (HAD superfamily)
LEILREAGARPEQAVSVGDSLMSDIAMAQAAGVADVHAAYGHSPTGMPTSCFATSRTGPIRRSHFARASCR